MNNINKKITKDTIEYARGKSPAYFAKKILIHAEMAVPYDLTFTEAGLTKKQKEILESELKAKFEIWFGSAVGQYALAIIAKTCKPEEIKE